MFITPTVTSTWCYQKVWLRQLEGHCKPHWHKDSRASKRRIHPAIHIWISWKAYLERGAERLCSWPHTSCWPRTPFTNFDLQTSTHQCFISRSSFGEFALPLIKCDQTKQVLYSLCLCECFIIISKNKQTECAKAIYLILAYAQGQIQMTSATF